MHPQDSSPSSLAYATVGTKYLRKGTGASSTAHRPAWFHFQHDPLRRLAIPLLFLGSDEGQPFAGINSSDCIHS
jgi:hypothetical protein